MFLLYKIRHLEFKNVSDVEKLQTETNKIDERS